MVCSFASSYQQCDLSSPLYSVHCLFVSLRDVWSQWQSTPLSPSQTQGKVFTRIWCWCMFGEKSSMDSRTRLQWLEWIHVALSATFTAVSMVTSTSSRPFHLEFFLLTTIQSPGSRPCVFFSQLLVRLPLLVWCVDLSPVSVSQPLCPCY